MKNSTFMHRLLNFIYNKNIDIVEEVFVNKVPDYLASHLIDKKNQYKSDRNDNTKAWLDFIGNLDNENSEILIQYITKNAEKPVQLCIVKDGKIILSGITSDQANEFLQNIENSDNYQIGML